jgi:hypothetical protein
MRRRGGLPRCLHGHALDSTDGPPAKTVSGYDKDVVHDLYA